VPTSDAIAATQILLVKLAKIFMISSLVVLLRPENGASGLPGFAEPCKSILLSGLQAYYREFGHDPGSGSSCLTMADPSDIQ
jgi:hypothetical protein